MIKKIAVYMAAALCVAQIFLVLASWLVTAAMPEDFAHSLLSSEGIRWFFGGFVERLASPYLVWLMLASMAYGTVRECGILEFDMEEYRQRIALRLAVTELIVFVVVLLFLTFLPHAILVNALGELFPSPFSRSFVPYVCFAVIVMSLSYGWMSEHLKGLEAFFDAMSAGVRLASPLFLLYVLAVQFFSSVVYLI